MDVSVSHQVWVAQKAETDARKRFPLWSAISAGLIAATALFAYFGSQWLLLGVSAGALICGIIGFLRKGKQPAALPKDRVNVTITPDADRLFQQLDAQMRSIDRCLNDFSYLNEQLRGTGDSADTVTVSRASDLIGALYECDEENREPAEQAARDLLASMGLSVMEYSPENRGCFNILPSKQHTRTLSPAVLSVKDHHLLRRGTAAVASGSQEE